MRAIYVVLIMALAGCLVAQSPHNPIKKIGNTEETLADVIVLKAATSDAELPRIDLNIDKVEPMKEMFLVQRDINRQILKMAEQLSEVELMDINLWLQQYGVQIQRKQTQKPKSQGRSQIF